MNRTSPALVAFAVVLIAAPTSAQTLPTAQHEIQSAQFLIGKWSCAHTVGDFSGTYTTTYASTLGSAWLEQTYDFPGTKEDAAVHADYFLGYDVRVDRWVRFGAHSNAQYYGMLGTRADNVWSSTGLAGASGARGWAEGRWPRCGCWPLWAMRRPDRVTTSTRPAKRDFIDGRL